MNLQEIEAEVYDGLGLDSPDDRTIARIRRFINAQYREILGMKGMHKYRMAQLSFTCNANNPFCVLPQVCKRIDTIVDRTNQIELDPVTLADIRWSDPGQLSASSFPDQYAVYNLAAPVALDPSTADQLYLKSTSASDGSGMTAYISGILGNNYPRTVSQTLNGTTAVALDPTITNWTQITKFYLSGPAQGDVTLLQTNGLGTELARIPRGRSRAKYTRILLYPYPTTINTYYADVELLVEPLIDAFDEPLFIEDYHSVLAIGARMKERKKRGDTAGYSMEKDERRDLIGNLILDMSRPNTTSDRDRPRRWSQLGAMYPAGS